MLVGDGNHKYEAVPGWGSERPMGVVTAVAVNSQDRVYALDREPDPAVVVFDRYGHPLAEWGHDILSIPHEIWIDPQDRIYIPDCGDHTVRVFTAAGELLQTLGTPGQTGADGQPFNQPTRVVTTPSGELYVADGYGQCYMHHLAGDGTLLRTWGGRGPGPGQFTLPHNVFPAGDGRLLVLDREPNNRIQIFEPDGTFVAQWPGRPFPCGIYIDADDLIYLAEGGGVSILTIEGRLLSQWVVQGGPSDRKHGAHGIWVDRHGDIYVGEVGVENLIHKFAKG
jgi:DNA-binding beta-propeller fold protein YncE